MKTEAIDILPAKQLLAIVFVVFSALSTAAAGQTIYKCAGSYSQTPCPGGNALNLDDARDQAQKQQTDKAVRQDAKLAQSLEKERLDQEKAALKHTPAVANATLRVATNSNIDKNDNVVHKITPKRIQAKHKKPEAFVALVPGSEQKPTRQKNVKKKISEKTPATPA